MAKILSMETVPLYAQVALFDPSVKDAYPDWGTGETEAVTSAHGVAVETRPDHLGPVAIEVWEGVLPDAEERRLVIDGHITVSGPGVVVGSVTGNDLHSAPVPRGTHRVQVYVNRDRGDADQIYFVFPELS